MAFEFCFGTGAFEIEEDLTLLQHGTICWNPNCHTWTIGLTTDNPVGLPTEIPVGLPTGI